MKFQFKNPTLAVAIGFSVLVHAGLLAVRFTTPDAFRFQPTDPGLEVILVNAKQDKKPLKADALAQANLDGGGNAATGRAKSPLPDMRKSVDGESVKSARKRVTDLEEQQRKLMAQLTNQTSRFSTPRTELDKPRDLPQQPDNQDAIDSAAAIARREAEIARSIEDYNKRPKKTQITPSTTAVGYAMYYKALQDKIEKIGTLNFPQQDGKKMYGELVVYIPIYQDGTIYEKDGGPRVERSSGNKSLDAAAVRIARRAGPFGRFPNNMRSTDKDDVWEILTRFKFTRDDALQTELRGKAN